jgi:hypothetical protein
LEPKKVDEMSKGMIEILAFVIVLGIILLIEYFVVGYFVRFDFVVGRFLREAPLLSEGDKVETYVRSFQNAVELSLLQGIYDMKNQSQNLWFDYGSTMPDETTIKNWIIENTTVHVNEYLTDYSKFAKNNGNINIQGTINPGKLKWANGDPPLTEGYVSIEFNDDIEFKREKDSLTFDRTFKPSGTVRTEFETVWDLTNILISNDLIGENASDKVKTEITTSDQCTVNNVKDKLSDSNGALYEFEQNFNNTHTNANEKIGIALTLEDVSDVDWVGSFNYCQFKITVKVVMEDNTHNYPVFNGSAVIEDYLGLIYRIKTGNGLAAPIPCPPDSCNNLLTLVQNAYGSKCGDSKYDKRADINKNKSVNLADLSSIILHCDGNYGSWCQERLDDPFDPCVTTTTSTTTTIADVCCCGEPDYTCCYDNCWTQQPPCLGMGQSEESDMACCSPSNPCSTTTSTTSTSTTTTVYCCCGEPDFTCCIGNCWTQTATCNTMNSKNSNMACCLSTPC